MSPETLNGKEFAQIVPWNKREQVLKRYNYAGSTIFTFTYDGPFVTLVSDQDGLLSIPSGGKDDRDLKAEDTAIRETFEEVPLAVGGILPAYTQAQFGVVPPLILQRNGPDGKRIGLNYPIFINLPNAECHLYKILHKKNWSFQEYDVPVSGYHSDLDIFDFKTYKLENDLFQTLSDPTLWRNPHWNIPMFELACSMGLYATSTIYKQYCSDLFDSIAKPVDVIANGDFMTQNPRVSLRDKIIEFPLARIKGSIFFRKWFDYYLYEKGSSL